MEHIYLTTGEISTLEENTIGQASSNAWHEARQYRISSTNVHLISTRKQDFESLTQTIIDQREKNLHSNFAVRHDEICSTTYPCGLVIDSTAPHICCSPDALLIETSNNNKSYGILECKCVFGELNATWDDLIFTSENFCLEQYHGRLRLRPSKGESAETSAVKSHEVL
ncbi:unnamed protein product [Rotaria sp. Silwood2]|nr:unnamed protein product [Rotaria sp. Silwood2]